MQWRWKKSWTNVHSEELNGRKCYRSVYKALRNYRCEHLERLDWKTLFFCFYKFAFVDSYRPNCVIGAYLCTSMSSIVCLLGDITSWAEKDIAMTMNRLLSKNSGRLISQQFLSAHYSKAFASFSAVRIDEPNSR